MFDALGQWVAQKLYDAFVPTPWSEGDDAYHCGSSIESCPYPEGSQQRHQWLAGFHGIREDQ